MRIENVKIGSDIEFFVSSPNGIQSAEGLIKGTKKEPFRFDPKEPFFATQLDNVLAEGNIPPATSAPDFVGSLAKLRAYIDSVLPDKWATTTYGVMAMRAEQLETENAKNFGCDPSYNAWTGEVEEVGSSTYANVYRSAGFHVHVGYDNPDKDTNIQIVRMLDLYLGCMAAAVGHIPATRCALGYGKMGSFRHQPHGVEYRTLSTAMYPRSALVFSNTMLAIERLRKGEVVESFDAQGAMRTAIETPSITVGSMLCRDFGVPLT